jgi:uncharacterized damage-inducible protein DinB
MADSSARIPPSSYNTRAMISPAFVQTMARYNRWMNERLYELCATLPDGERKRDLGAFLRSIHGTLNHLLLADRVWSGRFLGRPFEVKSLDQELYADFGQLRAQRESTDRQIEQWARSLTAERLAGTLRYASITSPAPRAFPLWLAVAHLFNHQTHHRGRLTALMKQVGVDPGVTDLIWLPELPSAAEP